MKTILCHSGDHINIILKQSNCNTFYLLETQATSALNITCTEDFHTKVKIFSSYIKAIKSFVELQIKSNEQDYNFKNENPFKNFMNQPREEI